MKRRIVRPQGGRDRIRREVEEEVRFHLERKVEALMARGLSREEAEREAARRFGDVDDVKEEMERMSRNRAWRERLDELRDGWRQDVGYAARQLLRSPLFTAVVVLTLALGIGANTAIFSVVDGILFRPLPFPDSDELVNVWSDVTERGGPDDEWLSFPNFHDLRERTRTLEALAAWGGGPATWTDPETPEQLLRAVVTHPMLPGILGVDPALGRTLTAADDRPDAPPVIVLAHSFWQSALGGDPGVVGTSLTLNGESHEVVGVMPEGFRPPFVPNASFWSPARIDPATRDCRGCFSWRAVGRVADGVAVEAAAREMRQLGDRLAAEHPESNTGMTFTAVPLRDDLVAPAEAALLALLAAVGMVLLVACLNVANLLLVRATGRTSELAMRSALGAGRGRLVRQLLTESLVLAALGGAAGLVLAWFGTDLLVRLAPDGTPRIEEVAVDGRVLAFTLTLATLAGLAFGLVPALRVAGADLHDFLRDGARGAVGTAGARLRSALVVGQVAAALVLLLGAGLLVRSAQNLATADLGFDPAGVTSFRLTLLPDRYPEREQLATFAAGLEERLAAIPGVTSVGITSTVPLTGFDGDVTFFVEGRPLPPPGERDAAWYRRITPTYLGTMDIELVRGRGFTDADGATDPPVIVVNETLASRFFPDEDPIGRRITFGDPTDPEATWREIVGVASDIRNFGIREGSRNAVYAPWAQLPGRTLFPVMAIDGPEGPVIDRVRATVAEMDPALAVAQIRPMTGIVRAEIAPARFVASLLAGFAVVGLLLALVGLYGVVSYGVRTRVREMGVRMALGAGRGRISAMVVGRSLGLVAVGLVVGLGLSWLGTGLLDNLLYGVRPTDPATLVTVSALLGLSAAAAAAVPARRATRIDPSEALRAE